MGSTTARYLGTAKTVRELIEMIKPYSEFDLYIDGCNYTSSEVEVYCNEEEEYIELN